MTILVRKEEQKADIMYCDILRGLENSHYEKSNRISGWGQKLSESPLMKAKITGRTQIIKNCVVPRNYKKALNFAFLSSCRDLF